MATFDTTQLFTPTPGPWADEFTVTGRVTGDVTAAPDAISTLWKLFPEQMVALLLEGAGAAPGMDGALSDAERAERLASLSGKAYRVKAEITPSFQRVDAR